jgi:putative RecB family exonuclease
MYDYNYVQNVTVPDFTRRYIDRGQALHKTIEKVCERVKSIHTDEELRELAFELFEESWEAQTDMEEYDTEAHYRYDRQLARAGIEDYFGDGPGLEHVRNSVASEVNLSCERQGVSLHGRADNVVETDDGLKIVDYKPSLSGIITGKKDYLGEHSSGEEYHPGRVKSMFQAATYLEGVKNLSEYDDGMELEFTFYGLLQERDFEKSADGVRATASGRGRDVAWIYEEHYDKVWEMITETYEGILNESFEPEPWELIRENVCEDCDYRRMCADYISSEVRFDV